MGYLQNSRWAHSSQEILAECMTDGLNFVHLYKQNPDMFNLSGLPFRERLVLLTDNYQLFKGAFKFYPRRLVFHHLYELFLLDPRKYGRYVKLDNLSKENLERLIEKRPRLVKNLKLDFNKLTESAWVALLRQDYAHYAPLFYQNIDSLKRKGALRYVFKLIPILLKEMSPDLVARSCMNEKDYVLILHRLESTSVRPSISADLFKHLDEMSLIGILSGEFRKTRPFDLALRALKRSSTH